MKWLVRSAMKALYPSLEGEGEGDLKGLDDAALDAFLDRYQREAPGFMWAGLVMGAALFTASPVLTVRRPVPSFLLDDQLLDEHANLIASHRIYLVRQAVFLVKLAAGLCWGADPEIRERFALDPYPDDPGTWRGSES